MARASAKLVGAMKYRSVLRVMVRRDLRIRYARSVLGYVWTILDPLSMCLVYWVVFAIIFDRGSVGHQPYILFLLSGLLPWQWFNASVLESARALMSEQKMVRSSSLPRQLWVLRVVIAKGIEFLLSLPVLIGFAIAYVFLGHTEINWRLILIPVAIFLQFMLCVGIGLVLAPLNVLVTDSERVVRIILRVLFYATPIIYATTSQIPWIHAILIANPLTGIMELYRAGLFHFHLDRAALFSSVLSTIAWVVIGWLVFKRLERPVLKEI